MKWVGKYAPPPWWPWTGRDQHSDAGQPSGGPGPPARIAVVTDSAAALPAVWQRAAEVGGGLLVAPMPVTIAGTIYGEGVDELGTTLSLALAEGRPVQTSRPSPRQLEKAYQLLAGRGYEAIVSIHISSGLSGTADAARLAAAHVDIPVEVFDTRTVGMAQGYGVIDAVASAATGGTIGDVLEAAFQAVTSSTLHFYVPSLEQLRRGGRVGTAASWLGTMLAIKPILGVRNGLIVPLERVRSAPRAIARLEELAAAEINQGSHNVELAVHHFGNAEQANELLARIAERSSVAVSTILTPLPVVLAAHAGLGVLAVIVRQRNRVGTPDL